jgi:hypothetical protein
MSNFYNNSSQSTHAALPGIILWPVVRLKVKVTLEKSMKAQMGELIYISTLSLTSALDVGGWSTSLPVYPPGKTQ